MKQLGKYVLLEEIGQGGMGSVYRARDEVIGRDVAIKLIHERVLHVPEVRERFFREASAAGRLTHPNIVVVHDVGDDDGMPFIVMELLGGTSLRQVISGVTPPAVEEKLSIAIQLAEGLGYAHKHQVIHRDVKPENIQVLERNRVKILDFGIARLGASSQTLTRASLGTPRFMSPEQIKGHKIDHRTDIFSFGVVLYELLTGTNPFSGEHLTTIIYKILHETPEPIQVGEADLEHDLQEIVSKCLEKDADQRYQDLDDVVADLSRVLARRQYAATQSGSTVSASTEALRRTATRSLLSGREATAASRLGNQAARRVRPLYLFGVAVLVLAAISVGYVVSVGSPFRTELHSTSDSIPTQEAGAVLSGALASAKQAALAEREQMLADKHAADSVSAHDHAGDLYEQAVALEDKGRQALARGDEAGLKEAQQSFSGAAGLYQDATREATLTLAAGDEEALKRQAMDERRTMIREKNSIDSLRRSRQYRSAINAADQIGSKAQRQLDAGQYAEATRGFADAGQKFRAVRNAAEASTRSRRTAEQSRADAQHAREQVASLATDTEQAAAFRRADLLLTSAGEKFEAGQYDDATKRYRDAKDAFAGLQQVASHVAGAQNTDVREAADQAGRDNNPAKSGSLTGAEQADQSPSATPEAPSADAFIRTLSARVRDDFAQENLADLRALSSFFDASWSEFFNVAADVKAAVNPGPVDADGSRASFTMQLRLSYLNNKNEPSVMNAPLLWTLERTDSGWKVAGVRAAN